MCLTLKILFEKSLVLIEIMQELILGPTFGCVVPNFYFSPTVLKPFNGEKNVAFVTCNYSPDNILVLSLSVFKQYIHDNYT